MSKHSFILSNYVKPSFIQTDESSCNCSYIDDNTLLSCWRNFTFIDFKYRQQYSKIIGKHIWFNDSLWSDSKLLKIDDKNKTKLLKYFTKTNNHKLRSSGCEDFRIIHWENKTYALYSKIITPFSVYDEHFCEIDKNYNIINDITIKTQNKIEKNWQPIENIPFECVYSYKPFKTINLKTKNYTEYKNNVCSLNYRGSTQVVSYKDKNICIVHLRNETDKYHYYTHYFVIFDNKMNLLKITKPFSFMGADIEFCTYIKNKNNILELLMSVNDQLSFKYEIPEDIVDNILAEELNNNSVNNTLYDELFKYAIANKNIDTAICLATYSNNKDIISNAIIMNHNSNLSSTKKNVLQKILLEKYRK